MLVERILLSKTYCFIILSIGSKFRKLSVPEIGFALSVSDFFFSKLQLDYFHLLQNKFEQTVNLLTTQMIIERWDYLIPLRAKPEGR